MSLDPSTSEQIAHAITRAQAQDDHAGDIHVHVAKRRKHIDPFNPFALCFTGSLSSIIQQRQLSPTAMALLFLLLDLSKFGNLVSVNQNGLAQRLGVKQPAVSKSLAKLVGAGLLLEMDEGIFFNPQIITKQGLDTVAKNNPAAVLAGIDALRVAGMSPNWQPPQR